MYLFCGHLTDKYELNTLLSAFFISMIWVWKCMYFFTVHPIKQFYECKHKLNCSLGSIHVAKASKWVRLLLQGNPRRNPHPPSSCAVWSPPPRMMEVKTGLFRTSYQAVRREKCAACYLLLFSAPHHPWNECNIWLPSRCHLTSSSISSCGSERGVIYGLPR